MKESNKLQVDAKHAGKARDPYANVVVSGNAAGSTGTFPNWYFDNSSSFQGIQSLSVVEPLLSSPLYEWEKLAETADCLLLMVR